MNTEKDFQIKIKISPNSYISVTTCIVTQANVIVIDIFIL